MKVRVFFPSVQIINCPKVGICQNIKENSIDYFLPPYINVHKAALWKFRAYIILILALVEQKVASESEKGQWIGGGGLINPITQPSLQIAHM